MTIGTTVQAYSITAMRLSISTRPPAATASPTGATPPAPAAGTSGTDTVSISGDPSSPATTASAAPPTAPTKPTRAGALLEALDSDKDGVLSKTEFTEGAAALLRGTGERRYVNAGQGSERGEERSSGRLERKLARAFARIDGNDDGSIDEAELGAAMSRRAPEGGAAPPTDGAPAPEGGTSVSVSYVRVSYVSVAIQRYTSLQPQAAEAPTASAPAQPPADPVSATPEPEAA